MPIVESRNKILLLPLVRSFFNAELGKVAKTRALAAASRVGMELIVPDDDAYTAGSICSDADVRAYYETWKDQIWDIQALLIVGGNFMEERGFQDMLRLLPNDVPVFLLFQNDDPSNMAFENRGDALCGSLSIHHNARMLDRSILVSRGIDMGDEAILDRVLTEYNRIACGIESLRNMRIAMVGVNPVEFATTFTNQLELFRLGFSLHTYELLDLWGATVLAGVQETHPEALPATLSTICPDNPVPPSDERVAAMRSRLESVMDANGVPDDRLDLMLRCFLWIEDIFARDGIDTGGIHCWTSFERYFHITPCTFAALANSVLQKPLVCETDICHAIMLRLAWVMTGEPGVILDINNSGWDPRVFNVFHCSQTPPEWLRSCRIVSQTIIEGDAAIGKGNAFGSLAGEFSPLAFTGISAATTSDRFTATVFQGQLLPETVESFGSNGWAFVPNLETVLDVIHDKGIHHFVALKGHHGTAVAKALEFRGLEVFNLTADVPTLAEIEAELGPLPASGKRHTCPIHSR